VPPLVATRTVPVGDDRVLTLDDLGDPEGVPVVYLHGTPDSRLARHPDDGIAATQGVRLLALDRPGYGGTSPLPRGAWPCAVADALAHLGVGRCAVLAWSGGTLDALALAIGVPERVGSLGVVSGIVPAEAYDDPDVRAAGTTWIDIIDLATEVPAGALGEMVAPMLAPHPCDLALAAEHQAEHRDGFGAAELATVQGGAERMAAALVEAARSGLAGVAADVEAQSRPSGLDLGEVACPTRLWYGASDSVTPPVFGGWLARRIPNAHLEVVESAGHYVLMTRWAEILAEVAALA
jgi:pimeloyl-ACP methyl ester carboxylesterase